MNLIPVIGLEVHVQLKTKSKMFCSCTNVSWWNAATEGEQKPNSAICPICMGHPGTLPTINKAAVELGVRAALALHCSILRHSKFDRKNYFYPDLPKGYQISQYDEPVAVHGYLDIEMKDVKAPRTSVRVGITRLHLEEDAAKLMHSAGQAGGPSASPDVSVGIPTLRRDSGQSVSLIDFNRAGTPLAEIVSEPDMISPQEAKLYLQELRLLMRYLGVSNADMEQGNMRADANISLHEVGETKLYPKTELKNLNSFKAVERALEYEIKRQTKLWEEGTPPTQTTTRGWDDVKGISVEHRTKEGEADYRYFPEPDLPPLQLEEMAKTIEHTLPELPQAKRARFVQDYGFAFADASILVEDKALADFIEKVISELRAWLLAEGELEGTESEVWEKSKVKLMKLIAGWTTTKLLGILNTRGETITQAQLTPENFAEFLTMVYMNKISGASGLVILEKMLKKGSDPSHVTEEEQLGIISDTSLLEKVVAEVIEKNPKAVADFKAGKAASLQFLVGQAMRATRGKVNAIVVENMLKSKLAA